MVLLRTAVLVTAVIVNAPATSMAQQPAPDPALLTEAQSLQLGLNQSAFTQLLASRLEAAQSDVIDATTRPNPEFEWSRQEVGDETETSYWLRQQVDVSGQRQAQSEAAHARVRVATAEADALHSEHRAKIRRRFFQTLHDSRQLTLASAWLDKAATVEATMQQRETAGDVSGYDRRRISREKIALLAERRSIQAQRDGSWERLLAALGDAISRDRYRAVTGDLLDDSIPSLDTFLALIQQRPVLQRLQHEADSHRLEMRAARRSRYPDITLGIGLKTVDQPAGDDSGLMFSAGLPLPLFDHRRGPSRRSAALAVAAESEYRLALAEAEGQVRSLWQQARQLADNARLFREQSVQTSAELVRIAEAAYHSGEIGVLELIDAYRSALDAEAEALTLELQARLVRIELDAATVGVSR